MLQCILRESLQIARASLFMHRSIVETYRRPLSFRFYIEV